MKRLMAIMLVAALIMVCGILPISANAASAMTVTAGSKTVAGGETFEIQVVVSSNDGFCYLKANPVYDDTVMTLVDAVNGEVSTDDYEFTGKNILWSSDDDTKVNGVLVTYTFHINEDVEPGTYDVGIKVRECYDMNEDEVEVAVENGKVTVAVPECTHAVKTQVPSKNADCVNVGNNMYYVCASCGLAFKMDGITETTAEAEMIPALGHSYADATCTAPKTCKVCGAVDGKALGHSFTKYTSNGDATCTADGTKTAKCDRCAEKDTAVDTGSAKGHDYADATCTEPKTCKICGAVDGKANGHAYAEAWSKDENGHWNECTACGEKSEVTAHDYGVEGDLCTACGYERAHVHSLTKVPGVDATCTESGSKAYYVCADCEGWFADAAGETAIADRDSIVIEAKGHDYAEATCVAPKTCKVCDVTEGEALGHNWLDASCTAPKTCERCAATEGEALDHTESEWISDDNHHWKECTAEGCEAVIDGSVGAHNDADADESCDVCGHTVPLKSPDIPQTGDSTNMLLLGALMLVSMAGVLLLLGKNRVKNTV